MVAEPHHSVTELTTTELSTQLRDPLVNDNSSSCGCDRQSITMSYGTIVCGATCPTNLGATTEADGATTGT